MSINNKSDSMAEKKIKFRKPFERLTPINECKVIQVIQVKSIVGEGDTVGTPIRQIVEYYGLDGELLARYDSLLNGKLEQGVWS